jgi:hypothetical protein
MKIFVEGGSKGALNSSCRRGFRELIRKALPTGCGLAFDIVPCGSRTGAFRDFCTALANGETDALLLVDGEDVITNLDHPTTLTRDPWQHLAAGSAPLRPRPVGVASNQVHLMAVSMETWLVADAKRLADYYGPGFQASALPAHAQLENVTKADLNQRLARAVSSTKKGAYSKGGHSFDILATLVPAIVEQRLPHAKRFFDYLRSHC